MCLITADKTPKIAQEDIVCYKILTLSGSFNDYNEATFVTPFQYCEVEFDKLLVEEESVSPEYYLKNWNIGKGWFHTFKTIDDACDIGYEISSPWVFKCIIPKGTEYYEGKSLFDVDNYASKKLIITKEQV